MKPSPDSRRRRFRWGIGAAILIGALAVAVSSHWARLSASADSEREAAVGLERDSEPIASPGLMAQESPAADAAPRESGNDASFRSRPFAVARASDRFQWTAEDGRDPEVIRALAHNEIEYGRMVEENARIFRRQLVYRTETAADVVQRARLTGEPVQRLTVPALDGEEVEFEIALTDLEPSGQQGMFAGHLVGREDSVVTLAFKGGREAFTVVSPADGLYLQGDPREPGELIVKSIDPDTYVPGVCGTP